MSLISERDSIKEVRRQLFNKGTTVTTLPSTDNKTVEVVALNADIGLWRKIRKAAAKTNKLGDGFLVVLILRLIAIYAIKVPNPLAVRAKASCNEGDVFSFEKGRKLAKARVQSRMLWKQDKFVYQLTVFVERLYHVINKVGDELYEDACEADYVLDDLLEELHEPQGE